MTKELPGERSIFNPVYTLKNVFTSFLATAILLFLAAVAVTYASAPEGVISAVVLVVTALCIVWGGFRASRYSGRQGLISGGVSGLVYVVLLYLVGSLIFGEFIFASGTLLTMLLGIGCGAVGGIIGVNTKKRRR